MSPLKLGLILHTLFTYISLITTLPITSKPLDNTPEHLTWEAWLLVDSKNPSEQEKTRKITPKSIFITPNFNNISTQSQCPDGFKNDHKGQCIQIVSINQDEYYKMRLDSILGTSPNDDDISYEYDNYDVEQQAGPLQINIPFNINFDPKPPEEYKGDFDDFDDIAEETTDQPFHLPSTKIIETPSSPEEKEIEKPATSTESSNLNVIPLFKIDSTTDQSTVDDVVLETTTVQPSEEPQTPTRSTTQHNEQSPTLTTTTKAPSSTITTTISSLFDNVENKNDEEKINHTNEEQFKIEMGDRIAFNDKQTGTEDTPTTSKSSTSSDNNGEYNIRDLVKAENEKFKDELEQESFLFNVNGDLVESTTSMTTDFSSTEESSEDTMTTLNEASTESGKGEFDVIDQTTTKNSDIAKGTEPSEPSEESSISSQTTETSHSVSHPSTIQKKHVPPPETSTKTSSTSEAVMIVTPQKYHLISSIPVIPTSTVIASFPSPTSTNTPEPSAAPEIKLHHNSEYSNLRIENETNTDKILREKLIKHEEKESDMENIDTRNRFVYHHLGSVDTPTITTTQPPSTPVQFNDNHVNYHSKHHGTRVRFPSPTEFFHIKPMAHHSNTNRDHERADVVRFPGPASQRISSPAALLAHTKNTNNNKNTNTNNNNLTGEKKPFWWLPQGWQIDQRENGSALLKLWQTRPVIPSTGDSSTTTNIQTTPSPSTTATHWRSSSTSSGGGRENSRLPTENLYREISSHDIYKVLSAINLNHNR